MPKRKRNVDDKGNAVQPTMPMVFYSVPPLGPPQQNQQDQDKKDDRSSSSDDGSDVSKLRKRANKLKDKRREQKILTNSATFVGQLPKGAPSGFPEGHSHEIGGGDL